VFLCRLVACPVAGWGGGPGDPGGSDRGRGINQKIDWFDYSNPFPFVWVSPLVLLFLSGRVGDLHEAAAQFVERGGQHLVLFVAEIALRFLFEHREHVDVVPRQV